MLPSLLFSTCPLLILIFTVSPTVSISRSHKLIRTHNPFWYSTHTLYWYSTHTLTHTLLILYPYSLLTCYLRRSEHRRHAEQISELLRGQSEDLSHEPSHLWPVFLPLQRDAGHYNMNFEWECDNALKPRHFNRLLPVIKPIKLVPRHRSLPDKLHLIVLSRYF